MHIGTTTPGDTATTGTVIMTRGTTTVTGTTRGIITVIGTTHGITEAGTTLGTALTTMDGTEAGVRSIITTTIITDTILAITTITQSLYTATRRKFITAADIRQDRIKCLQRLRPRVVAQETAEDLLRQAQDLFPASAQ